MEEVSLIRYLTISNSFMDSGMTRVANNVPSAFLGLSSLCIINHLYPMLCKVAEVDSRLVTVVKRKPEISFFSIFVLFLFRKLVYVCTFSYFIYAFVFFIGFFLTEEPCQSPIEDISTVYSVILVTFCLIQSKKKLKI